MKDGVEKGLGMNEHVLSDVDGHNWLAGSDSISHQPGHVSGSGVAGAGGEEALDATPLRRLFFFGGMMRRKDGLHEGGR